MQDADSIDKAGKKTEGAYYVWTAQEVDEVLGTDTELGRAFKQHYYVKANGNVDLSPRRSDLLPLQCPVVICRREVQSYFHVRWSAATMRQLHPI